MAQVATLALMGKNAMGAKAAVQTNRPFWVFNRVGWVGYPPPWQGRLRIMRREEKSAR